MRERKRVTVANAEVVGMDMEKTEGGLRIDIKCRIGSDSRIWEDFKSSASEQLEQGGSIRDLVPSNALTSFSDLIFIPSRIRFRLLELLVPIHGGSLTRQRSDGVRIPEE